MKMTAKFHLPGLRYNYPLNMMLLSLKEKYPHYFRDNIEIASFFGEFPTSLWNGGRFSNGDQCDRRFVEEVVKSINTRHLYKSAAHRGRPCGCLLQFLYEDGGQRKE